MNKADLYTSSVYKEIFDKVGVKVYTQDEINQIISEKEEKLGITDEMIEALNNI